MAKISELPLIEDITGDEDIVVVSDGETGRIKAADHLAYAVGKTINDPWRNHMSLGDFVGGDQPTRSGSAVVALTHPDMIDRGIDRGIQWRAGNEYFRYASGGSLLNKYFFAAMIVNSVDAANLLTFATVFEEAIGGALTNPSGTVAGTDALTEDTQIAWSTGLIDTDVPNFVVGSATAPSVAGTRFASDVVLYLSDDPINKDEALRQMNLAAKARKEARRWARSVAPLGPVTSRGVLVLAGTGNTAYVESDRSGHLIRNSFAPFRPLSLTAPHRFNIVSQSLDGVQIRTGASDDIAPDHALGATIDANHGYLLGRCTAAAHGKDSADLGSIWATGGNDHVLVAIENANTLLLARMDTNSAPATGTFTHVSGATNTGNIGVSAVTGIQWYPPAKNYSLKCYVDGGEVSATEGSFPFANDVTFIESCDILPRPEIIAWWAANGGSGGGLTPGGDAAYRSVIAYRFDRDGQLTVHRQWIMLDDAAITDFMGLQVGRVSDPDSYRVPGAEDDSYDGDTLNYGLGVASDRTLEAAGTPSIYFDNSNLQADGEYAHRLISGWTGHAFAVGLLPLGDAAYDVRQTRVSNRALEIRGNTAKVYFRLLDTGGGTLGAGASYSMVGFRHVLAREAGRPLVCPVRYSDSRAIVYVDWVDFDGIDQIGVPPDLVGRSVTVLDSRNASLVGSGLATGSITASVDAEDDHAYLVLEFAA